MPISLIPKDEKFFELFELQAKHNAEAAAAFKDLAMHWSPESPNLEKLRDIEHEADITTHEIIDKLNRTFITPFDREDIHELATEMDDVVDLVQSISARMKLYHVTHSSEDLVQLADILSQATNNIAKAVTELKNEKSTRRLLDYCIEVNRLENAGDHLLGIAISKLFSGQPDPVEVIKWKEIYETIEAAIDKCEDIANTIEGILVKQG